MFRPFKRASKRPEEGDRKTPVSAIRPLEQAPVIPLSTCSLSTEQRLYRAIQEDQPGWKRELFDHYVRLVRGLIGKSLGPREDAEDLVSDVFLALLESAPNIRSAETMRSYVVSVVLNTVRREFKKRKRRRLLFIQDGGDEEVDRLAGTDDPRAKVAFKQLAKLLDELSDEERIVYVLHILEGQSIHEVTETLDMSRSTVKRRLKRANERMLRRVARNPLLTEYLRGKAGEASDE